MKSKFASTVLLGLAVIIPILAGMYLFRDLYQKLSGLLKKILQETPLTSTGQLILVILLTLLILVLIAYLVGLISRSKPIVKLAKNLDEWLLNVSPLYRSRKVKIDNQTLFMTDECPPVFVLFGENERPGFLMEKKPEFNKHIVFIPKNFSNYDGHVYIVPMENVRLANTDKYSFIASLDRLGYGLDIS